MRRRNGQRTGLLISLGLVAGIACTLLTAPAQADVRLVNPDPDPSTVLATQALADVQALLDPVTSPSARAATATPDRDLTMALRDLRMRMDDLSPADRAAAARLTSRPASDRTRRSGDVLAHWQSGNGIKSGYVDLVLKTVTHVLSSYRAAGYRAPESDGSRGGGTGLLDIYLEDLGGQGLYGYCDSDQGPPSEGPYDTWAYCAFDDDFAEFPSHTPTQNLQVTAAHELFHAVQFAYDYVEDQWFMEATATWAEDEVYDGVNDNRQYLPQGPLGQPGQTMDQFQQTGLKQYGDWVFFRYLTERFPHAKGGLPTLVRGLWARADGSVHGPDDYSLQAIRHVLVAHHTTLTRMFAEFAAANRHPARAYTEGRHYEPAPLARKWNLSSSKRGTGWQKGKLDHLASRTVRVVPNHSLRGGWRIRAELELPVRKHGSAAVITTYRRSGGPRSRYVRLNRDGDATRSVNFDSRSVSAVEVTLVNAGAGYRCWYGTQFSCRGRSTDDDRTMKFRLKAVR